MEALRVGRNEQCPCGSGKKFKYCCLHRIAYGNGATPFSSFHPPPAPVRQAELVRPPAAPLSSGETIESTAGHPFWVISGEDLDKRSVPERCPTAVPNAAIPGRWVNAIDLRVGDILFSRDGRRVPVTNVSVRHVKTKVYNLQVEGLHNYAVGHTGILVHNSSGVPQPPNVPNLAGMNRAEAHIAIQQAGYTCHGTSAGGYVRYRHPSGAEIQIRPNGEIIRLGPPVTPQGGGRPYHPRIDSQGNPIPTHSTGEFVPPLPARSSP